jgi:hypothetical protein
MRRRGSREIRLAVLGVCVGAAIASPARADDTACIASSEQSLVLRKQGALHGALAQLAICADPGCPAEVKAECALRIDAVTRAMPTLVLAARDAAGNDLLDIKVTMDGAPLASSLDGRPVSLDPGKHSFRFEAAGKPPVDKQLVLREGEKDRRETIVFGGAPASPKPLVETPTPSSWTARRTVALVGGGVGLVGLGLGAVFGGYALAAKNDEGRDCPSPGCATRPQAVQDYNTAKDNATGSTVAFVVGGALVAAGAVLWLTEPARTSAPAHASGGLHLAPGLVHAGGELLLGGQWE